ncbi:phosphonate metabolism protein/1,5-bisphosphokinase (PRPP-forming) PhnN [Acidovorax sp. SRB_14]|uniref:phosphonate metabolism protein/1,5-bisphosphokinase (PRPP-forming) PhnN n=1 Tax=Acidovorax sp. SRB_14 TaxID=1962699 RepID=UPI001EC42007|nr:phosphonate metabolism protein/1,5-bisphosphokinase (PRPP-forming) PhnN [Acidovorax sp. SRB_14]
MTARLIYVMGPSGAGKDSLLDWLRARLPPSAPVHWSQRTISRKVVPGGENHESVLPEEFASLRDSGAFALHWTANGLDYGIRHAQLAPAEHGQWVLINGSRGYWSDAQKQFAHIVGVHITANPQVLRQRLLLRGRETPERIEARVQRAMAFRPPTGSASIEVHNDRTLDYAGNELLAALRQLSKWPV